MFERGSLSCLNAVYPSIWSSAARWSLVSHVSVRHMKSCDVSFRYSQIAGTFEGIVRGLNPLMLKTEKQLTCGLEVFVVACNLGEDACWPPSGTAAESPSLEPGMSAEAALVDTGDSEAGRPSWLVLCP